MVELVREHRPQSLGFWSLTAIVVANMIGAGVYTTSGFTLSDLGSRDAVMLAWVVGGAIAFCGAVSYALLVGELTANGGEYLYLSRWIGPLAGFLAGWSSYVAGFTAAGAYAALAFERYAAPLISVPAGFPSNTLAIALVFVATLSHGISSRGGTLGQNVVVAVKLSLIIGFIVLSLSRLHQWPGLQVPDETSSMPNWTLFQFANATLWISLSYAGFNGSIYIAGEAGGGRRSIAASMIVGTAVTTVIYLLLNYVFVYAALPGEVAGAAQVASVAAVAVGGEQLGSFVRLIICLGLASSVLSLVQIGPRVYAQMAADGLLPTWFSSDKPPPRRAILFQAASIIFVIQLSHLQSLLSFVSLTLAFSSTAAVVAFLAIRVLRLTGRVSAKRAESDPVSCSHPASEVAQLIFPLAYVLATASVIGLTTAERPKETLASLCVIACGVPLYFAFRRQLSATHATA